MKAMALHAALVAASSATLDCSERTDGDRPTPATRHAGSTCAVTLDKRFALISSNGDVLFPYMKHQEATGRTGFVLTDEVDRDRFGGGKYTTDLKEVIRGVVFEGLSMRVRTEGKSKPERDGSVGLGKQVAYRFFVAPEFEALVSGAHFERVLNLPTQRAERRAGATEAAFKPAASPPRDIVVQLNELTAADYVEALRANQEHLSDQQRAMLLAHHGAPNRLQSLRQLAAAAGLNSPAPASLEYGKVGRLVADDVGLDSPGNWVLFLATASTSPATDGDFGWVMRPSLADALEVLGWAEPDALGLAAQAARAELSKEPTFDGLPETTKQALVNARIGQGRYRRRMLELWGGRCAVTGCALSEVLVASHEVLGR